MFRGGNKLEVIQNLIIFRHEHTQPFLKHLLQELSLVNNHLVLPEHMVVVSIDDHLVE